MSVRIICTTKMSTTPATAMAMTACMLSGELISAGLVDTSVVRLDISSVDAIGVGLVKKFASGSVNFVMLRWSVGAMVSSIATIMDVVDSNQTYLNVDPLK